MDVGRRSASIFFTSLTNPCVLHIQTQVAKSGFVIDLMSLPAINKRETVKAIVEQFAALEMDRRWLETRNIEKRGSVESAIVQRFAIEIVLRLPKSLSTGKRKYDRIDLDSPKHSIHLYPPSLPLRPEIMITAKHEIAVLRMETVMSPSKVLLQLASVLPWSVRPAGDAIVRLGWRMYFSCCSTQFSNLRRVP